MNNFKELNLILKFYFNTFFFDFVILQKILNLMFEFEIFNYLLKILIFFFKK